MTIIGTLAATAFWFLLLAVIWWEERGQRRDDRVQEWSERDRRASMDAFAAFQEEMRK